MKERASKGLTSSQLFWLTPSATHTRQSWQNLLGRLSAEARDRYLGVREYERIRIGVFDFSVKVN